MSEQAGRESRVRAVVVIAVFGLAAMLVPSAYAAHRGAPNWAAAAIALAAFPVLPLVWHLLAERRRRRAPPKRGLTATDRFVLRELAVAAVVIGPLIALGPGAVWSAVRHDGLWWLDWSGPSTGSPVHDHRLLDAVPDDAEVVLYAHDRSFTNLLGAGSGSGSGSAAGSGSGSAAASGSGSAAAPAPRPGPAEAVLALGPGGMVVGVHAAPALLDRLRFDDVFALAALAGRGGGKVVTERPAPDVKIARTDGWTGSGGGAVAGLLDDAPRDTVAALVARPHGSPVEQAQVWLTSSATEARLQAVVRARDEATAKTIASWAPTAFAQAEAAGHDLPASCRDTLHQIREALHVEVDGVVVRGDASVSRATFAALERCGAERGAAALKPGTP